MEDLVRVYLEMTTFLAEQPRLMEGRARTMGQTLAAIEEYLQDNGGDFMLESDGSVSVRGGPFAMRSREGGAQRGGERSGQRSGQQRTEQSSVGRSGQRTEQRTEPTIVQQGVISPTVAQLHAARGAYRQMPTEPEEPFAWTPAQVAVQQAQRAARSSARHANPYGIAPVTASRSSQAGSSRRAVNTRRYRVMRSAYGRSRRQDDSDSNFEHYDDSDGLDY
jgi:hypothetical protein